MGVFKNPYYQRNIRGSDGRVTHEVTGASEFVASTLAAR